MSDIVTTGIAVVESAGHYLVGQRPSGVHLAGYHEFPGGKCEPGESPADCAVRECAEETGVAVRSVDVLFETCHAYSEKTVCLNFLLCEPIEAVLPKPDGSFAWIPADQLSAMTFPDGNAEVLKRLAARNRR